MEARPTPQRKPTYSVAEASEIMGVSEQAIRKQIRRHLRGERGPEVVQGRKVGTCYRVLGAYIEQWLRADEPQPVRSNAGWS